ncbi:MAG: hypothetical protein A2Y61_07655 [Chloroflexi bacterium RBG_13_60_13]|nr:MAG: hypothetical protein A2Y61_07655 [Chloroflexi bacterium RBG_13_60_13]
MIRQTIPTVALHFALHMGACPSPRTRGCGRVQDWRSWLHSHSTLLRHHVETPADAEHGVADPPDAVLYWVRIFLQARGYL